MQLNGPVYRLIDVHDNDGCSPSKVKKKNKDNSPKNVGNQICLTPKIGLIVCMVMSPPTILKKMFSSGKNYRVVLNILDSIHNAVVSDHIVCCARDIVNNKLRVASCKLRVGQINNKLRVIHL